VNVPDVLMLAALFTLQVLDPASPAPEPPPMNPTQEIAKETPEGPAIAAGPTEIRIGGYLGVTGIYRSTNAGGGPATGFGTIPYSDTVQGNVSESRLSAQPSRLSIRVNAAPAPDRATLAGYFEMDFNGSMPGNVAVTSTSVGFRLRNAFGEAQFDNRFLVAAGQAYTLMTAARDQLSVWPSDFELTQAVDMNYVAGIVWGRTPQVRFTYRPSKAFNWALSIENPEQQIGDGLVALPACCSADLDAQYNTGANELSVPNLMPDIVSRVAFNAGRTFHLDVGGVVRVFRHALKPYTSDYKQAGGGMSFNARVAMSPASALIGQLAAGAGMGRYIGGLIPDVAVSADGIIHPIRTTSWVAGVEQKLGDHASLAFYDSGVVANASYSVDADGSFIGFGYPGAPNADNRRIHEVTSVLGWRAWAIENRGSLQWTTQVSRVSRTAWPGVVGPASAAAVLLLSQLRYNLP